MKDINVTKLIQSLPAYLARVRRGERIRITSRGEVIAELAPPAASPDRIAAAGLYSSRRSKNGSTTSDDSTTSGRCPTCGSSL